MRKGLQRWILGGYHVDKRDGLGMNASCCVPFRGCSFVCLEGKGIVTCLQSWTLVSWESDKHCIY